MIVIIFFDCEVLKYDWLVVFMDMEKQKETVIVNDVDQLKQFYEENKERIWVGYNARHYDQYIIKGLLLDMNPYEINNKIIVENKAGWQISDLFKRVPLYVYDAMVNRMKGLKELEGHMGNSIKESSVPFTLQRKCSLPEIDELVRYCRHDVEQTVEVFMNQLEEYTSHMGLLKAFNMPLSYVMKTKAQLSAMILEARKVSRNDAFDIILPDTLQLKKYKFIADWYIDKSNHDYDKFQTVDVYGVEHVFGWGGVHGAIPKYKGEGVYVMSDVASLYPAIMIEYGTLSRNVKTPEKYREIRDERLRLKAIKDPTQQPLKIVLNGTYGASKDKNNSLFDERQANNTCITGMTLLLMLLEMLEVNMGDNCQLIQSNTDGILVKLKDMSFYDQYISICDEWCKLVRLDLEHDLYEKVIQKDVNNYVIVDKKGKYKSKGAYVKKLSVMDYDLPIVNKAVVNYLIHGTPARETIEAEDNLIEFQKIVKISSKFDGGVYGGEVIKHKFIDGTATTSLNGGVPVPEKINRVFASRSRKDGSLYKMKNGKPHKIANTPEKCFIYNDSVHGVKVDRRLNKKWYIDLANKRISDFLGYEVK